MAGIAKLISPMLSGLPPWAIGVVVALVAMIGLPIWLNGVRQKQIKGLIRRRQRAEGEERERLAEQALALADCKPGRLVVLATEAAKFQQLPLYETAMALLKAHGGHKDDLKRLSLLVKEPPKLHGSGLEAAIIIERLVDEGLLEAAAERYALASAKHPNDADLQAAGARLQAQQAQSG